MPHVTEPKPSRYVVYYVNNQKWEEESKRTGGDWDIDPDVVEDQDHAETLTAARKIRRDLERSGKGSEVRIYERVNLHPVTRGDSEFSVTDWEGDEELVED